MEATREQGSRSRKGTKENLSEGGGAASRGDRLEGEQGVVAEAGEGTNDEGIQYPSF